MNKIIVFILLKILEITGIVFIPYYFGKLLNIWSDMVYDEDGLFMYWLLGIAGIVTIIGVPIIIFELTKKFIVYNINLTNLICK